MIDNMSSEPKQIQSYSPGLMAILPLFYVGWSDSVLSPSEMKLIHKRVNEMPFLTKEDIKMIEKWTNPKQPPSETEFKSWVKFMKNAALDMPSEAKENIIDLGLEMAIAHSSRAEKDIWESRETRQALIHLSEALGIDNPDSEGIILRKIGVGQNEPQDHMADARALRVMMDGNMIELKERMRNLLKDPVFNYEVLRIKEDQRKKVYKQTKLLAEQGLGAVVFPEAYGGKNDYSSYAAIFEVLAAYDLSLLVKFGVQFGLFGCSILNLGTERHHEKYLTDVGTLDLPGCFAMTETGHGSNVRGLETIAEYLPETEELLVHSSTPGAQKEYIGNAMHAQMATVFAQLIVGGINQGVHAVLVPVRDKAGNVLPGVSIEDNGYKMGLNGVDNGIIRFDHVRVPKANLLNRFGDIDSEGNYVSPIDNSSKRFFTMLGTLVAGRICVGLGSVVAAKKGLTIAIRYALNRRQFGNKSEEEETLLMDYPLHQRRLLPLLAKTYALGFALSKCSDTYATALKKGTDLRQIETLAAALKSCASWHGTATLQECREACGGKGYLMENALPDLKADADIFTTFEGDNNVLLQLVAKGLLSDFRQEFHEEGYRAVMRYLADRFTTTVTELNPIITRRTDVSHLKDEEFQLDAFRYREKKLLISVGQRMQRYLAKRINPYDAFMRCQTHMIELAKAFAERYVLEEFIRRVKGVENPRHQTLVKDLCDLYALHTIEANKGWYLENDYLHPSKTKAIRRVVNKLCQETRVHARLYVDAFGIPEELLNAKILK